MPMRVCFLNEQILFFLCCLALTAPGCDQIYRFLDKEGAQEQDLIGEVVPYEANPKVAEIQALLEIYGYDPGAVDGVMGVRTRDAVEQFQKDNNLKPSRFVDKDTWLALNVFKEKGFVEDGGLDVQLVQTLLRDAGFNPGKIDGKFGPGTKAAVESFQKARGLKVDGKVGYQTLKALSE